MPGTLCRRPRASTIDWIRLSLLVVAAVAGLYVVVFAPPAGKLAGCTVLAGAYRELGKLRPAPRSK